MEFVLLGALGAFGYYANYKGSNNKPEDTIPPSQLIDEFNQDVAEHLKNNDNVIIGGQTDITNNVPFFRSMKSQNTNSMVKDRRLETFTGVNNVDYQKKQEREADAPVKGLTNIYGTTFAPDFERYDGYLTNGIQNNVTPFEKQYVGPGLGVSVDTPSSGGFHSRFRIMPDNVNGYRKNTFGGEIVVGKSHIDASTVAQKTTRDLSKLDADEMSAIGSRPLDAAHGHVQGPSVYSDAKASLLEQHRGQESLQDFVSTGSRGGSGAHVVQQTTRTSENVYATNVMGGQHRPGFAGGAYQTSRFLMPTESDRETQNTHRLNVGGNTYGSVVAQASTLETQRGDLQTQQLGKQQPGAAFTSRDGYVAPPTQKEHPESYRMGIVGSGIAQSGTLQNTDPMRTTLRGQAFNKDGSAGPAGSFLSAPQQYSAAHTSHERVAVYEHAPNAQRTVNMMLGTEQLKNTVTQQRSDQNDGRVIHGQGIGVENFTDRSQLGTVFASEHLNGNTNTRDFGYVPDNELRTNIMIQPSEKY